MRRTHGCGCVCMHARPEHHHARCRYTFPRMRLCLHSWCAELRTYARTRAQGRARALAHARAHANSVCACPRRPPADPRGRSSRPPPTWQHAQTRPRGVQFIVFHDVGHGLCHGVAVPGALGALHERVHRRREQQLRVRRLALAHGVRARARDQHGVLAVAPDKLERRGRVRLHLASARRSAVRRGAQPAAAAAARAGVPGACACRAPTCCSTSAGSMMSDSMPTPASYCPPKTIRVSVLPASASPSAILPVVFSWRGCFVTGCFRSRARPEKGEI